MSGIDSETLIDEGEFQVRYFWSDPQENYIISLIKEYGGTGSGNTGPTGPTGAGGVIGYWGSFWSTAAQTTGTANTPTKINYNNTDPDSNGISIQSGTKVTFANEGTYSITYSIQFVNEDNNPVHVADVWLTKNNAVVADSNSRFDVPVARTPLNGHTIGTVNYVLDLNAGDYLELIWQSDSTQCYLETIPAAGAVPTSPSIILTAQQVAYSLSGNFNVSGAGTGSILLNNPTGSTGVYYSNLFQILDANTIQVGASIIPDTNEAYDLGQTGPYPTNKRFRNIYADKIFAASGTVYVGDAGISAIDTAINLPAGSLVDGVLINTGGFNNTTYGTGSILLNNPTGSTDVFYNELLQILDTTRIQVGTNVLPATNDNIDLGVPNTNAFRNIFARTIQLGSATIQSTGTAINLPAGSLVDNVPIVPGTVTVTGTNYSDYLFWDNVTSTWAVGSAKVHIGGNAGGVGQGNKTVAVGTDAGINQKDNTVAIGNGAGQTSQQAYAIALGSNAGSNLQNEGAIAIGFSSGQSNQGLNSIAIGNGAVASLANNQNNNAIAIGGNAGTNFGQGTGSIAIGHQVIENSAKSSYGIALGYQAGQSTLHDNSIIISAEGTPRNSTSTGACYIAPLRSNTTSNVLYYDTTTKEVSYNTFPSVTIPTSGTGSILLNNPTGSSGTYYSNLLQITDLDTISVSGHIIPSSDITYDLGTTGPYGGVNTGSRFRNIFAQTIYASAGKIYVGDAVISDSGAAINLPAGSLVNGVLINTGASGTVSATGTYYSDYLFWNNTTNAWTAETTRRLHIGQRAGENQSEQFTVALGAQSGMDQQRYTTAVGGNAGQSKQATGACAFGFGAGQFNQGANSIAIGSMTANGSLGEYATVVGGGAGVNLGTGSIVIGALSAQGSIGTNIKDPNSIIIGYQAGNGNYGVGTGTVAIGYNACNSDTSTGAYSLALGYKAGYATCSNNSIILNAGQNQLDSTIPDALFINPIRGTSSIYNLNYNTTTKEVGFSNIFGGAANSDILFFNGTSATGSSSLTYTSGGNLTTDSNIVPTRNGVYSLGNNTNLWNAVATNSINLGNSAAISILNNNAAFTSSILPLNSNTYDLGSSTSKWANVYVGTGSVSLTNSDGALASLSCDYNGCINTPTGFSAPALKIGSNQPTNTNVGGWQLSPTGTAGTTGYTLNAQQLNFQGTTQGLTGSIFNLLYTPSGIVWVSKNGSDSSTNDGSFSSPFLTITKALQNATNAVWVMPGVYEEIITIPSNIAIRGMNLQSCVIQKSNVNQDTTVVTMGQGSRLEDITVNVSTSSAYNITGIVFPNGTAKNAKLRTMVVNASNTYAGTTGNTCRGIYCTGTTVDNTVSSFNAIQRMTINATNNTIGSGGFCYGVDNASNAYFSIRDTTMYATGAASTCIGALSSGTSAFTSIKTSTCAGKTYDIDRTGGSGCVLLINATDLQNASSNGNGFSVNVEGASVVFRLSPQTDFSGQGSIINTPFNTYYLRPGSQFSNFSLTATGLPFSQNCIVFSYTASLEGTLGTGVNAVISLLYTTAAGTPGTLVPNSQATISDTNPVARVANFSYTYRTNEFLQVQVVIGTGSGQTASPVAINVNVSIY